jgi:general L-amino acid transport system permease protein
VDTVSEKYQDMTSKFRPSRNDAPRVAAYLVIIFFLWQYFTKFFSLSKEIIDSIAFSVIVNDIQLNESYYSLSETIWVLGPIFLLFFTLACNEYRSFFLNPREWRGYSKTIIMILGFLLLIGLSSTLDFRPKYQVWMIMAGLLTGGLILVFDEVNGMLDSLVKTLRSPKDVRKIWFEAPLESSLTFLVISLYLIILLVPILLPAFGIYFIGIFENVVSFLSLLLLAVFLYSAWDLSLERHNPNTQDQKLSSTVFLFAIPFILFLVLRVMYLVKTSEDWILSYDFMDDVGGFPVTNWPWQIDPSNDSRWTFYRAGVINSARVTLISIVLCTILGIFIGVSRLSNNKLAAGLATAYVEFFRNIPLAILLFFVSIQIREWAPAFSEEFFLFDLFYISKEGHWIPQPETANLILAISILIGTRILTRYLDKDGIDDSNEGVSRRIAIWALAFITSLAVLLSGDFSIPELIKPNLESPGSWYIVEDTGFKISSPFIYIVTALTLFTASVVAEIVRGSIQSLPSGQVEAAISLGLSPFQRLRLVILPQALRSMIPLLNSQYMNVWKNSSLAIIVGFSDIFLIILVMMNNVGKLVPLFMLLLITYQVGSLIISAIMNVYNAMVTRVRI